MKILWIGFLVLMCGAFDGRTAAAAGVDDEEGDGQRSAQKQLSQDYPYDLRFPPFFYDFDRGLSELIDKIGRVFEEMRGRSLESAAGDEQQEEEGAAAAVVAGGESSATGADQDQDQDQQEEEGAAAAVVAGGESSATGADQDQDQDQQEEQNPILQQFIDWATERLGMIRKGSSLFMEGWAMLNKAAPGCFNAPLPTRSECFPELEKVEAAFERLLEYLQICKNLSDSYWEYRRKHDEEIRVLTLTLGLPGIISRLTAREGPAPIDLPFVFVDSDTQTRILMAKEVMRVVEENPDLKRMKDRAVFLADQIDTATTEEEKARISIQLDELEQSGKKAIEAMIVETAGEIFAKVKKSDTANIQPNFKDFQKKIEEYRLRNGDVLPQELKEDSEEDTFAEFMVRNRQLLLQLESYFEDFLDVMTRCPDRWPDGTFFHGKKGEIEQFLKGVLTRVGGGPLYNP